VRTTLTLSDDVAARLRRLRARGKFKDLVNDALRAGLDQLERRSAEPKADYRLTPVKAHPRRTNLDNISEVLAEIESDTHP
jgi:Arc/MetJ-type ribon-helix-helix transcriptional regulator